MQGVVHNPRSGPAAGALVLSALALLGAVAVTLVQRRALELAQPVHVARPPRALPLSTSSIRVSRDGPTLAELLQPLLVAAARPVVARFQPSSKDVLTPDAQLVDPGEGVVLRPGEALLDVVVLLTLETRDGEAVIVHAAQAHEAHGGADADGEPEAHVLFVDEQGVLRAADADLCDLAPALLPALEERVVPFPGAKPGARRTFAHTLRLPIPDLKPRR